MSIRILFIETSGSPGLLAISQEDRLLRETHLNVQKRHARDLVPSIKELLEKAGWNRTDLSAIAVGIGPGSYTGLRVGVMIAKTLAFALRKPLIALPTFAIHAHAYFVSHLKANEVSVLAPALKQQCYCQTFTRPIPGMQSSELKLITNSEADQKKLSAVTGPAVTTCSPQELMTSGIQLAHQLYLQNQFADPFLLEPIYLTPSSAEVQWSAAGK